MEIRGCAWLVRGVCDVIQVWRVQPRFRLRGAEQRSAVRWVSDTINRSVESSTFNISCRVGILLLSPFTLQWAKLIEYVRSVCSCLFSFPAQYGLRRLEFHGKHGTGLLLLRERSHACCPDLSQRPSLILSVREVGAPTFQLASGQEGL